MTIEITATAESKENRIPEKYAEVTAARRELVKMSEEFRWDIQQLAEKAIHKLQKVLDRTILYERYLQAYHVVRMKELIRKRKAKKRKKIKAIKADIKLAIKQKKPLKLRRLQKQLEKTKNEVL
jgi:hypothetical protein